MGIGIAASRLRTLPASSCESTWSEEPEDCVQDLAKTMYAGSLQSLSQGPGLRMRSERADPGLELGPWTCIRAFSVAMKVIEYNLGRT